MGKKLVWIPMDGENFAVTPEEAMALWYERNPGSGPVPSLYVLDFLCAYLRSLPSALLIGAEEREELAKTIYDCDALGHNWKWDDAGDYARRKREKYLAVCDAILAAGWRKVAAVDREKLVEAIVGLIHDERYAVGKTCLPPSDTARALLARVEGETTP